MQPQANPTLLSKGDIAKKEAAGSDENKIHYIKGGHPNHMKQISTLTDLTDIPSMSELRVGSVDESHGHPKQHTAFLLSNKWFWAAAFLSIVAIPLGGDSFSSALFKFSATVVFIAIILCVEYFLQKRVFKKGDLEEYCKVGIGYFEKLDSYKSKIKQNKSWVVFGALLFFGLVGGLFTLNYFDIGQIFGADASKTVTNYFNINPMKYQGLSYDFGYQITDAVVVMLVIMAYLYYRARDNKDRQKTSWGKILVGGFFFTGIAFGLNVGLHWGLAHIPSVRPVNSTQYANSHVPSNIWSRLNNIFGGIANPAISSPLENWPSGHTEWTIFTACILLFIARELFHSVEGNEDKSFFKNIISGTRNCLKKSKVKGTIIIVALIFGVLGLLTGLCRYLGLAHTALGVFGGAFFGIASALFVMNYVLPAFEKCMNKAPWTTAVLLTSISITGFGAYQCYKGDLQHGMYFAIGGCALAAIWLVGSYLKKHGNPFKNCISSNADSLENHESVNIIDDELLSSFNQ